MVCMYMYLNYLIVCDANDGITDRLKECLEFALFLLAELVLEQNVDLGAIYEFDIGGRNILGIDGTALR